MEVKLKNGKKVWVNELIDFETFDTSLEVFDENGNYIKTIDYGQLPEENATYFELEDFAKFIEQEIK